MAKRSESDEPVIETPVPRGTVKTYYRREGKRRRQARGQALHAVLMEMIDAECELFHDTPFQLLVAVILSAQATDAGVNLCTPGLFGAYPDAKSLAAATPKDVEPLINSIGLFRNKAKNIVLTAQALLDRFDGEVPRTMDELTSLPGVGRKTANVVLGTAFQINSGIAIDTHANRVSSRLALSVSEDPVKVEAELMEWLPQDEWTNFSHRIILHGRYVCKARKPECHRCPIAIWCPSRDHDDPLGPDDISTPYTDIGPKRGTRR